MKWETIKLGTLYADTRQTVDPSTAPDELFDLYSVPAYDSSRPEQVSGSSIGSVKQVVSPGDVLLCRIVPHIRRAWMVGEGNGHRLIGSGEWLILRHEKIHPAYLRQFLLSNEFHTQFMMTVAGVGGSLLRARPASAADISVPAPSLEEQRRIAAILDKADALRHKRRAALQKLDSVTQSVFLDMFGDPTTNPKGLPITRLGASLRFVTSGGRGWARYYSVDGRRFIRSLDVRMNYVSNLDSVFIRPPDNAEAHRTRIQTGDVLLTITGSKIGRVAPATPDLDGAFVSQHVAILRLDPARMNAHFLSFFLSLGNGGQRQIAASQYGQTKPGLNFDQIRRMEVPTPAIEV